MTKGQKEVFSTQALQVVDALLVWLGFVLAGLLRGPIREAIGLNGGGLLFGETLWAVYVSVPLAPLILERFGFYDRIASKRWGETLNQLFRAILVLVLVIGVISTFGKLTGSKRLVLGLGFLFSFGFLWFRTVATRRFVRAMAKRPGYQDHVVLVGKGADTHRFLDDINPERYRSWKIVAHLDLDQGSLEEFEKLVADNSVQKVIFVTRHTEFERVSQAVALCEVQGVEAWLEASFLRTQVAQPSFDSLGGRPMLVFRSTPELSWQFLAKSIIDAVGSLILLVFAAPLFLWAYLGIKKTSPGGPVIFRQKRAGLYGKPFFIYKFRTMVPDAERTLGKVKAKFGNEVDGPAFKLSKDPRVFPFGQFLRNYSIDELPQLVNVLKGQMSLVGPRPLPMHEVEAIANSAHRRRLSMKPGLTCLWQIGGRSNITSFDEWVKLDVEYIDRWSIWEDFRILLKTIPAVLFSKGAR